VVYSAIYHYIPLYTNTIMETKLEPETPIPLYIQIKELIQNQIRTGELKIGSRLYSERELSEKFHVSRMTARQAIQSLVHEGVLQTQIGKGTYVKPPKVEIKLPSFNGFTQLIQQRNQVPSSQVLKAEIQLADTELADKLNVELGTEVVVLRRIRFVDGLSYAIETSHVIHDVCVGILDQYDFNKESLYQVLAEKYGVQLVWGEEVIEVRLPNRSEAQLLEIDSKTPVFTSTRTSFTKTDKRIEYVTAVFRGDRHRFHIIIR
jgi:GntR family transcriptional regulator